MLIYKTDKPIRIFAILSAKPEILRVKLIFSILYEFVFDSGLNIYTLRVIKPHFKYVTFTAFTGTIFVHFGSQTSYLELKKLALASTFMQIVPALLLGI